MTTKIFPWTEIIETDENPDDYRWQSIDTEITEGEDVISFCDWGNFRVLARMKLDAISRLRTQFHSRPNIVSSIISAGNAIRSFASTSNIVLDISDIHMPDERQFASQANIVSDLSAHMPDHRHFASGSDIVSDIVSDADTEREFASQADIVSDINDIDIQPI
jgi:hypothetical protein